MSKWSSIETWKCPNNHVNPAIQTVCVRCTRKAYQVDDMKKLDQEREKTDRILDQMGKDNELSFVFDYSSNRDSDPFVRGTYSEELAEAKCPLWHGTSCDYDERYIMGRGALGVHARCHFNDRELIGHLDQAHIFISAHLAIYLGKRVDIELITQTFCSIDGVYRVIYLDDAVECYHFRTIHFNPNVTTMLTLHPFYIATLKNVKLYLVFDKQVFIDYFYWHFEHLDTVESRSTHLFGSSSSSSDLASSSSSSGLF